MPKRIWIADDDQDKISEITDYIHKPFDVDDIEKVVQKYL